MKKFDWKVLSLGLIALSFAQASAFASEGGVSGGGGGTVPADPVSAGVVTQEIIDAKLSLALYFNFASVPGYKPIYWGKLYSGSTTIFDLIRTTTVERKDDAPCVAPSGELTDGAAPGSTPNSVCISTLRLTQKLDADNVHIQTIALIAHELSHLLGTSEPEAVALQTDVIRGMRGISGRQARDFAQANLETMQQIIRQTGAVLELANGSDAAKLYEAVTLLNTSSGEFLKTPPTFASMSYLTWDMLDAQSAAGYKIDNLSWALCAQQETNPITKDACSQMISSYFKIDSEVTYPQLMFNIYGSSMNTKNPDGYVLRKITSPEILKLEVQDIEKTFTAEAEDLDRILGEHW